MIRLRSTFASLSLTGPKHQALAVLLLIVGSPTSASAHLVSTRFGELYGGILHPLTTLVHVVPWLGLGLLGGLQSARVSRWASVALPLAAGMGSGLGAILPGFGGIWWLNSLSFLVFGSLCALAVRMNVKSFSAIAIFFGLTHGYANANSQLTGSDQILYVVGIAIAAYVLITVTTAIALVAGETTGWGRIALRAAGSWIVAIGLIFVGSSVFSTGSL